MEKIVSIRRLLVAAGVASLVSLGAGLGLTAPAQALPLATQAVSVSDGGLSTVTQVDYRMRHRHHGRRHFMFHRHRRMHRYYR